MRNAICFEKRKIFSYQNSKQKIFEFNFETCQYKYNTFENINQQFIEKMQVCKYLARKNALPRQ